jgi:CRP-like cAMP-binding protein
MANEAIVDLLSKNQVFKELPRDILEAIAGSLQSRLVPRHSLIFKEGDLGDCLYIISSGSVRIFRKNEGGIDIDLSFNGPGEAFGEMALLTGEPRTAHVEALEETSLLVLTKESFDLLTTDFPDIYKAFLKQMRGWLVTDDKRLEKHAQDAYQSSRITWIDFALVIGVSIILATIFNFFSNPNGIPFFPKFPDKAAFTTISPSALREEARQNETLILDASPAKFYKKSHIKGAVNIPLSLFDIVYLTTFTKEPKEKKIVVYGRTVSKLYDLELANKLKLQGHEQVRILEGGLTAWEKKGYPVEGKGK